MTTDVDTLIEVHERKKDKLAKALADKQGEFNAQEMEIETLQAQRLQTKEALNESMAIGVSVGELSLYEHFLTALASRLKNGKRTLRRLQVEVDNRRDNLSESIKELQGYEKYRERRIDEMLANQKAAESRELNEIAIRGFYARKNK